jgi:hypothetical protein
MARLKRPASIVLALSLAGVLVTPVASIAAPAAAPGAAPAAAAAAADALPWMDTSLPPDSERAC